MILTIQQLAKMLDVGRMSSFATKKEILEGLRLAKEYSVGAFCITLGYLPLVVQELKNSNMKVVAGIAFPFGTTSPEVKVFEAQKALEGGAQEFDMCINRQRLKSGDFDFVYEDIRGVVTEVRDRVTKVILETCELTKEEIIKGSEITRDAGAQFVKTSGWGIHKARVPDIQLIKENVDIEVKAAGDIHNLYTCMAMIRAGATRIGLDPEDAAVILDEFKKEYGESVKI